MFTSGGLMVSMLDWLMFNTNRSSISTTYKLILESHVFLCVFW